VVTQCELVLTKKAVDSAFYFSFFLFFFPRQRVGFVAINLSVRINEFLGGL